MVGFFLKLLAAACLATATTAYHTCDYNGKAGTCLAPANCAKPMEYKPGHCPNDPGAIFCCFDPNQKADPYKGPLDPSAARGVSIATFQVPSGGPAEIAVVPKHLPFGDYSKGDAKSENKLAQLDFYKAGSLENGAVLVCPKRTSTSAGTKVIEPKSPKPAGLNPTVADCKDLKNQKVVANFKQTDTGGFTCTSMQSILGYYHISRALGDICQVQPAILRTMSLKEHRKVSALAIQDAMGIRGVVRKSWDLMAEREAGSPSFPALFTQDKQQIVGALIKNTKGESNYNEWDYPKSFTSTAAFVAMTDRRAATEIVGNKFTKSSVTLAVGMRDMSELILLDFIMNQGDRLSGANMSNIPHIYFKDGAKVKNERKAADVPSTASDQLVGIPRVSIKDTDCGLNSRGQFDRMGFLNQVSHMHPDTYDRLQTLNGKMSEAETKAFFIQELTFSDNQLNIVSKQIEKCAPQYSYHNCTTLGHVIRTDFAEALTFNSTTAASILKGRKDQGALKLDLDLDVLFA